MIVRIFTLCDGAYNYNGKLTIVGTVDNIKVPRVPVKAAVGIAVKIDFTPNENGDKTIVFHFKDAHQNLILPEMKVQAKAEKKGETMSLVIAGNINGLDIKEEGSHTVEMMVNNEIFTLPFKVSK